MVLVVPDLLFEGFGSESGICTEQTVHLVTLRPTLVGLKARKIVGLGLFDLPVFQLYRCVSSEDANRDP